MVWRFRLVDSPPVRIPSGKATAENAASLQRTAQAKAEALSHKWSTQNDALLAQARRAICETHKELDVAKTQIGLGAVMYGGMEKPPEASARARHPCR